MHLIYCQMSFYERDICALINFIQAGSSSRQNLMVSGLLDHRCEDTEVVRM